MTTLSVIGIILTYLVASYIKNIRLQNRESRLSRATFQDYLRKQKEQQQQGYNEYLQKLGALIEKHSSEAALVPNVINTTIHTTLTLEQVEQTAFSSDVPDSVSKALVKAMELARAEGNTQILITTKKPTV